MGEVATIAAIAGGIASTSITGIVTWKVSKNSSSVELVKVAAENHRLRYGDREDERRNRQTTYHSFFDALTSIYQILGVPIKKPNKQEMFASYNHLVAGVMLFGPPLVREKAKAVNAVYNRIWPTFREEEREHPEKPEEECWATATAALKAEFNATVTEMVHCMHADVTRGIAEEST